MQVQESLPYAAYFRDARFQAKKPVAGQGAELACGDNIYEPLGGGGFRQLPSMHSHGECADLETMASDLAGSNVLVSRSFWYFGSRAVDLPAASGALRVGRGHRTISSDEVMAALTGFLGQYEPGVLGAPSAWQRDDGSRSETEACAPVRSQKAREDTLSDSFSRAACLKRLTQEGQ
jgi:hypothetical protein